MSEDHDERSAPRNAPRYRHAQSDTLARFFRRTSSKGGDEEALSDLEDFARRTQDQEAADTMRQWVNESTHLWWDKKWQELKDRLPFYVALLVIMLMGGLLLYMTRARAYGA